MPCKTRKHLALKKIKTKTQKNKNAQASPKTLKQIIKKHNRLLKCKTKHCKNLLRKGEQYQENFYKARGWNKKMTKKISKTDTKRANKYERLLRKNNKDLEHCVKQFCDAQDNALKKILNLA